MKTTMRLCLLGLLAITGQLASAAPQSHRPADSAWIFGEAKDLLCAEAPRTVLSLNGSWSIAEGSRGSQPARFDHRVPVPGLVDQARPAFVHVGLTNGNLRQAFWYRRTFRLNQEVPAVALLKIHKAAFGAKAFLNGIPLGERLASFTPGYFDAKPALRGGGALNELIIRVGAERLQVPRSVCDGMDFEKVRYIPGIFDDVELILSCTPNFVRMQVAPDITNHTIRVQALLRNTGPNTTTSARFTVREARSRRLVGENHCPVVLEAGAEQLADVLISLEPCRLWSPEDPFLYELEAATETDSLTSRFGMRDFRLDPKTGRALLNGRPYFLRGSNVTLYRFFEDSERGNKPWREEWVRCLHRRFKEMHWNCLRYSIGFPPEFWYRIADEEGILIQDEFPIWYGFEWPKELTSDQLVTEFTEWMRERWNHPCVVIWDTQNETHTAETGKAIRAVRSLDLSSRPWDNGYGEAVAPDDVFESHPYLMSRNNPWFTFADFETIPGVPRGNFRPNTGHNPIILNEYGWLWLNRDGSPTTLSKKNYDYLLGTNSTAFERRHLYARYVAAKTELWRAHRACAGVLHFCALGYSRPGSGPTSDNFTDLASLKFEPEFQRLVGDAFAPVGLMLDVWSEKLLVEAEQTFPVTVINDLSEPWQGEVRFRVLHGTKVIEQQLLPCGVAPFGTTRLAFPCRLPASPGRYQFEAALVRPGTRPVRSIREIELVSPAVGLRTSLAQDKKVAASSCLVEPGSDYRPENAVDGRKTTRWVSEFSEPQWLTIDLGETRTFSEVALRWDAAYAESYTLEVSADGSAWKRVYSTDRGKGGVDHIRFKPVTARSIRLACSRRSTPSGFSLWEVEVY